MARVRSCLRIVATLVKSFIGTGIIFLPGSFRVSGIISGNICSALVCVLAIISVRLLVKCCQGKETLGELAERAWGRSGLILVDSSIFFSQLGFSTVYMIFVSHNIQEIIYSISSCQIEIPILKLICFQMVVYLPFVFLRDIENLAFPSVLANVSVFSVLGVIIYHGFQNLQRYPLGRPQVSRLGNVYGAGLVLGTSAFNYEGISLILPIRNSTPEHLVGTFPRIVTLSMIMIGVFSNFFASLVYYSFGDDTASPVTENILNPKAKVISLIIYSSAIMFSVPLQLFPPMGIIEKYLFQIKTPFLRRILANITKIKIGSSRRAIESSEVVGRKEVLMDQDLQREEISPRSIKTNPCGSAAKMPPLGYPSALVKSSENVSAFQNTLFSTSKVIQLVSISENWDSPIGKKVAYSPVESSDSKITESLEARESPPSMSIVTKERSGTRVDGEDCDTTSTRHKGKSKLRGSTKEPGMEDEEDRMAGLNQRGTMDARLKFQHSVLRALISYSLVLLCGALAYNFEDELGSFVTITGGLLCVPLAFVYPPLFYLSIRKDLVSNSRRIFIWLLVVIGCVISFTSIAMAILSWETNPRSLVCIF
ncbi:ABC transporter [Cryptosporidium canis]|uniref:ABC transporter n=1 Tax=Cryptosporidium canis TaxID=195482 RepID=A0A9D5HZ91_9CRYT|nr:ABC transporter [Cryptosporidium canis]